MHILKNQIEQQEKKKNPCPSMPGRWLWAGVIFFIILSRICWYRVQIPCLIANDSIDYVNFDTLAMFRGQLVNGRAPLYGMFLDLMDLLFRENAMAAATLTQTVLSIGSLFVFEALLRELRIGLPWRAVCVLLYGVSPAIVGWESSILTESFSLTGAVMFLYCTIAYIRRQQLRYGAASIVVALLLSFLRPQFQVYLALLSLFFLLKCFFPQNRMERRISLKLLAILLCCWILVLLYCSEMRRQFGVFSLNDAMPRQNLAICISRGYYTDMDDIEIVKFIEEQMEVQQQDGWNVAVAAVDTFGNERVSETTRQYFAAHSMKYVQDTVSSMLDSVQNTFCGYSLSESIRINGEKSGIFYKILPIQMGLFGGMNIAHALLISLLSGVAMVAVWVKRRTIPWVHMFFFSISMCTTFLTYFVTCGEYMRTMISVLPDIYCMVGMFLQMCSNHANVCGQRSVEKI